MFNAVILASARSYDNLPWLITRGAAAVLAYVRLCTMTDTNQIVCNAARLLDACESTSVSLFFNLSR